MTAGYLAGLRWSQLQIGDGACGNRIDYETFAQMAKDEAEANTDIVKQVRGEFVAGAMDGRTAWVSTFDNHVSLADAERQRIADGGEDDRSHPFDYEDDWVDD